MIVCYFLAGLTIALVLTGIAVVLIDDSDEPTKSWQRGLKRHENVIFAWHLAFWMLTGMVANHIWGWFNQKGADQIFNELKFLPMVMPVLIAPIVFHPTWSLWLGSDRKSRILFLMVAFQNGFFWQIFFQKASQSVGG